MKLRISKHWSRAGLLWLGLSLLVGCELRQISDPDTTNIFKESQNPLRLSTSNGLRTDIFYHLETLFVEVFELVPLKQYCIEVAPKGSASSFRRAIVTSDSLGRILDLPMWLDIGFDSTGNVGDVSGDYEVRVQGHRRRNGPFIRFTRSFQVKTGSRPGTPMIIPTNSSSAYTGGVVFVGDDLYARGDEFPPSTQVRIYVVEEGGRLSPGDALVDISGGFETVTTTSTGELPNTLVWPGVSANAGAAVDLVGDLPPFAQFDAIDALREARLDGVLVQTPPSATDIITQLAADVSGTFKDFFDREEIITVKARPPQQPLKPSDDAAVYIVVHQDRWNAGDRLIEAADRGSVSHEMPLWECIRFATAGKPAFRTLDVPFTFPGRYDVVIDAGRNFIYDPGTDILDGGSQIGFTLAGDIPPIRTFLSADNDFLPPHNAATTIYAKAVRDDDSPIVGAATHFEIIEGPGTLSVTSTTTDATGVAATIFSGGEQGRVTIVRAEMLIDDVTYVDEISIWVKTSLHDQGFIGGGR